MARFYFFIFIFLYSEYLMPFKKKILFSFTHTHSRSRYFQKKIEVWKVFAGNKNFFTYKEWLVLTRISVSEIKIKKIVQRENLMWEKKISPRKKKSLFMIQEKAWKSIRVRFGRKSTYDHIVFKSDGSLNKEV